jgi:PAS domain S-box-containing protein
MKKSAKLRNLLGRAGLIVIGILLSISFWILEAAAHVIVFRDSGFLEQIYRPEVHEAWMRFIVVSMFISFGLYSQWIVTARRRAEEKVRAVNVELTQIFETAADGMRLVDRDFNVLRANETFSSLSGLSKSDIIGKKCYEVFSGPLCNTPACPMIRILDKETCVESDVEKLRKDGTKVPCILTATPFRSPDGDLIGIVEDFRDISHRKKFEEQLMDSRERLRELTFHLQTVREEERTHIAREIHDELGQALTALKMDLHWLDNRLAGKEKLLSDKAKSMSDLVEATVQSVKRISSELRPSLLDDFGLSAAMEWQTEDFENRTGIQCEMVSDPEDIVLDKNCSIAVFRIFQETLTNIVRHSKARKVRINLKKTANMVVLEVHDDGIGITEDRMRDPKSFGLVGMRERAYVLGGHFSVSGNPGNGTTVKVSIPTG